MSGKPAAYPVYLAMGLASAVFLQMIYTPLAVYYVQVVQLNPLQLVIIGVVLEITELVFEVPTGVVADTYSRRLSIIIGECLIGIAFIVQGVTPLLGVILLGVVLHGIGGTFISGALQAWIADELGEDRVRNAYLRYGQLRLAGGIVGLGIGVALGTIDLALPIVIGGMLMLALGVVLVVVMPETGFQPASRGERTSWSAAWHSMTVTAGDGVRLVRFTPLLSIFLLVSAVVAATGEALDRLNEAHFIRVIGFPGVIHLEPIVWFGLINLGSSLLGLLAVEAVIRRLDTSTTARAANALFIINGIRLVAIVAFGLAGNFWIALAAFWCVGLLGSVIGPIQDGWLNRSITPSVRATVFSVMGQADALGQLAGGPAIGAVGTRFGLRAAMVAAGFALSPALLLYSRARHAGEVADPETSQARDEALRDPVE